MIVFEKSKLANFFFFLYTLTGWHFTCREEYRKAWLKNIEITNEKRKFLRELSKIFQEDALKHKQLQHYFFIENSPKISLKDSNYFNKKIKKINQAFEVFQEDFENFWSKEENELNKIIDWLESAAKEGKHEEILNSLKKLFGIKKVEDFKVIILKVPIEVGNKGGGSAILKETFTLEIPTLEYAQNAIFVLLHEIAHTLIKKNNSFKNFNIEKLNIPEEFEGRNKETFFEEFLLISLLPRGYFNISEEDVKNIIMKQEKNWNSLKNYMIKNMYELNKNYIDSGKEMDDIYIKKYYSFLENFFK